MNWGKEEEGKERERDRDRVDEMLPFILIRHCWFTGSVKHIGAPRVGFLLDCSPPLPKRN